MNKEQLKLGLLALERKALADPDLALWIEGDRRIRELLTDPRVQEYVNLLNRVQPPIAARSESAKLHLKLSIMLNGLDRSLVAGDVSEV